MVVRLPDQVRSGFAAAAVTLLFASPGTALGNIAHVATAEGLAVLRDIDGLSLSPGGDSVAFQTRQPDPSKNTYRLEWCIVSVDGGDARCIADGGEPILARSSTGLGINGSLTVTPAVWSPDGEWIAFLKQAGGRVQIWRSSVSSGRAQQLTHNEGDVVAFALSADGRRIFFRTRLSASRIAVLLEHEGRSGFRFDDRFVPGYSPRPLLPEGGAEEQVWVYELTGSREGIADDSERAEFLALMERGASAVGVQRLVRAVAREPSLQGAYAPRTITVESQGSTVVCRAPACTAQRFDGLWPVDDRSVAFIRREGRRFEQRAVYLWRTDGERSPDLVFRTNGTLTDCLVVEAGLVCFYETPAHPRHLVLLRFGDGHLETLFDPNPWWSEVEVGGQPELMYFRAPSGAETHGYLVLPPHHREGALSLVIVTYRCAGFLRGGVGDEYPIYALAAEGFAVLCFDAPADDYDRLARMGWSDYSNWARGPGDPSRRRTQELIDTAVAELAQRGLIDQGAVGITGLSFGADTVKYALFSMPTLGAAIASGAPMEPAGTFLAVRQGRELLRAHGLGPSDDSRWNALSLARNVDRVRAPLLLNVADHEMLSATQVCVALQDAGRAVEMYVFPDEYHIKWQPTHRLAIYERNIDWMNFWLRGVENPAPAKAEQYQRWRAMRVKQCDLFGKEPGPPWYCRQ